ncbi:phosphoribosyl-AMP cyclohydrolase [Rhodoluna sp.]|uniref:phosphoribosyl-AMP cyclohydrolase n=1 Tax=Rhodoluna sp. TaxID=1969481 RepID=UPI0025DF98BB|nr:phosphoribosyl-AMP cyclohydrolase [Rhodoluna sp.]
MDFNSDAVFGFAYNQSGLIPAIVQSAESKRVLMMAWMNQESLLKTIELGETVFYSRSRNALWHKGETSGNVQKVVSIEVDCDSDALLIQVHETGPACHNGTESCFDTATLFEVQD